MIKKGTWKIAKTPYTNWAVEAENVFEANPTNVQLEENCPSELIPLVGGRALLRTSIVGPDISSGGTQVKTYPRALSIGFVGIHRVFTMQLNGHFKFGQPIAVKMTRLFDTDTGADDDIYEALTPDSNNAYYYFQAGSFDELSLRLYDKFSNLIYQWTSDNSQNIYGFGIEGDSGRISTGSSLPPHGVIRADYAPIFYGRIVSFDAAPQPGYDTEYNTQMQVREISNWPVVTEVTRLYLRNTTTDATSPPTTTLSNTTNTGHYTAASGKSLSATKGSSVQSKASSSQTVAIESLAENFISPLLQASILPKDTSIQIAASILSGVTCSLEACVYVWRSRTGRKDCLLKQDPTVVTSADITGGASARWAVVEGTVPYAVEILEGDRIILELWGKKGASGGGQTVTVYWDGVTVGGAHDTVNADAASFIQFSFPIFLKG